MSFNSPDNSVATSTWCKFTTFYILIRKDKLHQIVAGEINRSQALQDINEVLTEGDEKDCHTYEEDMVA